MVHIALFLQRQYRVSLDIGQSFVRLYGSSGSMYCDNCPYATADTVDTLAEFEKIIPTNFKERYRKIPPDKDGTFATELAVSFLIIHDHNKYFKEAYKAVYGLFSFHDYRLFKEFGLELPGDKFDCD
jgi:hypothetical protein